jgi:hypothetical protein
MDQMLEKSQPPYPWFRSVTPSWDNSARKAEKAVIFVESSPQKYEQWLQKIVSNTIEYNRPTERIVFVNAWNEWAEGNHLEPCLKWGRSYLNATKAGIKNGLERFADLNVFLHQTPKFADDFLGAEKSSESAIYLDKFISKNDSPNHLTISIDEVTDRGEITYIKGWAVINDGSTTEDTEIQILSRKVDERPRLIMPARMKRQDITSYYNNGRNYDFSGFEAKVKRIDENSDIIIVIMKNNIVYWQEYKRLKKG